MRLSKVILFATILTVSLVAIGAFGTTPSETRAAANEFNGTVIIGSNLAPIGTVIDVRVGVNPTPCISTTVTTAGQYSVNVPDTGANCPSANSPLNFFVNGALGGSVTFTGDGLTRTVNLNVSGTGGGTTHTVSGTVFNNGVAVAGVAVQAHIAGFSCFGASQTTNASGGFTIIVPTSCGTIGTPITFTVNGQAVTSSINPPLASGGNTPNIILTLGGGTGTGTCAATAGFHAVCGTVYNNSIVQPSVVVQALVNGVPCSGASQLTDFQGKFTISVPTTCGTPGSTIGFTVTGQVATPSTTPTLTSGGVTPNITLNVGGTGTGTCSGATPGYHIVCGTVTSGGVALSGATVQAFVGGAACGLLTATNTSGFFSLSIPVNCSSVPQPISFTVNGQAATASTNPNLMNLGVTSGIVLTIGGTATTGNHLITGRLVNTAQAGLSGYSIQAYAAGSPCGGPVTTDASGNFTLNLPIACSYSGAAVTFQAAGQAVAQSTSINLTSGQVTNNVVLTYGGTTGQTGQHTINGKVYQGASTTPLPGAVVQALVNGVICQATSSRATTAADGSFSVVVPGSCVTSLPHITFTVSGTAVQQSFPIDYVAGATNNDLILRFPVSATSTPIPTQAPAATPTPSPTAAPTTAPGTNGAQWLDQPPGSTGAQKACPEAGRWMQLYWAGAEGEPIMTAASVCPNTDPYWVNRKGTWLGFTIASPTASDNWNLFVGEAHFLRGKPQ